MGRLISEEERVFLEQYDDSAYPHPSVATDIAIFSVFDEAVDNYRKLPERRLKILLIKRGGHPYKDCYALPGGFARPKESLDECARRELLEETHVDCDFLQQLRTFSEPGRDPRGWIISASYLALIDSTKFHIEGGDDAQETLWFDISLEKEADGKRKLTLSNDGITMVSWLRNTDSRCCAAGPCEIIEQDDMLSFDHAKIISCALFQLRECIGNSHIAFRLLPERFTLTQLQQVHEAVCGVKLLAPAFRRKISAYVQETGEMTSEDGHRPAKLYREVSREGEITRPLLWL